MSKKNRREILRERQRRKKLRANLIKGGVGLGVIAVLGFIVWNLSRPAAGEAVPIQGGGHISSTDSSVEYNSDPPTSGPHYSRGLPKGFYLEAEVAALRPYPERNLVHNLEHGYIIFYYNCTLIPDGICSNLMDQISTFIDDNGQFKLIGMPWQTLKAPLVLTSWGRILELDDFDDEVALNFIQRNRTRSPEPSAP